MKKYLLLFSALFLILTGCSQDEEEPIEEDEEEIVEEEPIEEDEEEQRTLEGLKNEFINEEFEVGDNEEIAYAMVNADKGMKFELDGELIEIYKYNIDDLSDEAEETVEQAKKGSIDMSGFNIPVKYNDGIMLVRYDDHSQEEKIIKVFNNY